MIPEHIKSVIELKLDDKIVSSKIQSGGDINNASIIKLSDGESLFLKWNGSAPEHIQGIQDPLMALEQNWQNFTNILLILLD
jgi:hypothetical protein